MDEVKKIKEFWSMPIESYEYLIQISQKGEIKMKQYDFDFRGDRKIESVEENLLDRLCEMFESNTKEIVLKSTVHDYYKNFVVEMESNIELDCEISWNVRDKEWYVTVWEM